MSGSSSVVNTVRENLPHSVGRDTTRYVVAAGLAFSGIFFLGITALLLRLFAEDLRVAWIIVGVPAALSFACFSSLALDRAGRASILTSLLAVAVAVYLAEFAIQLRLLRPEAPVVARLPADADRRSVLEVVNALRSEGKNAYPQAFPIAQFQHRSDGQATALGGLLPLGGISRVTTVYCNETGRYLVYDADEFGCNNPRGIWPQRQLDVLAVGDSFAQGACVDVDKSFMALIRKALPRTLSLGMTANGPLTMLASLREYLPGVRPRTVLWFLFEGNDVEMDLPFERLQPLLTGYLVPGFSQRLAERQTEIDARLKSWLAAMGDLPLRKVDPLVDHSAGARFGPADVALLHGLRNALSLPLQSYAGEYALLSQILAQAKALVDQRGAALELVYLPDKLRYVSYIGRARREQQHARVLAIAARVGIPVIDLVPAFAAAPNPAASLFIYHYTDAGNALVAREVLQAIAPDYDERN